MKLFDTHCHLNLSPLKEEQFDIMVKMSVEQCYVNIVGIDLKSSQIAVDQAMCSPYAYATIGIHPTEVINVKNEIDTLMRLQELLKRKSLNKIIAIGEVGFDFYRTQPQDYERDYRLQLR